MAFPTSREMLSAGLSRAQSQAANIKRLAQDTIAKTESGPISVSEVFHLLNSLRSALDVFRNVAALPKIGEYANEQLGKNVSVDFVSMMGEVENTQNWIIGALPKDAQGFLLLETIDANGLRTARSFSSSDTAGLRQALNALLGTID